MLVKVVVPPEIVNVFLAAVTVSKPVPVNVNTKPTIAQLLNTNPVVLHAPFDVTPVIVGTKKQQ